MLTQKSLGNFLYTAGACKYTSACSDSASKWQTWLRLILLRKGLRLRLNKIWPQRIWSSLFFFQNWKLRRIVACIPKGGVLCLRSGLLLHVLQRQASTSRKGKNQRTAIYSEKRRMASIKNYKARACRWKEKCFVSIQNTNRVVEVVSHHQIFRKSLQFSSDFRLG